MKRAVLAFAVLASPVAARAEPGDVPWYVQNPAERRAKLEWCARDAARQDTRECMNARAAGAAELMSPYDPWARLRAYEAPPRPAPAPPPPPPAPKPAGPAGRGPARGA